ncbi:MAG: hypothetical protein ACREOU_05030, partial [Candidatus Eiseniibacteriota bacterium]
MKTILRAGVTALLAVVLAVGAASAIEYEEVIELTQKGVSDRTIVELIVQDGRAFGMSDEEIDRLVQAGVSQVVIDAMLDPASGQAWLGGTSSGGGTGGVGDGGYSTPLDRAYNEGYGAGYSAGQSTALVYSYGYYYGPLSRYYNYYDPFYYPFYFSGYASWYWPSYFAFYWRPAYSYCYAYPYNYYNYSSYYCHTYYDPGYWSHCGYNVQPGYGRTVWDGSPRWRDGGVAAPKSGGRQARIIDGQFVSADRSPAGRMSPPPISEARPTADGASVRTRANQLGLPGRAGSGVSQATGGRGRNVSGSEARGAGRRDAVEGGDRIAQANPGQGGRSSNGSSRIIRSRPTTRVAPGRETSGAVRSNPGNGNGRTRQIEEGGETGNGDVRRGGGTGNGVIRKGGETGNGGTRGSRLAAPRSNTGSRSTTGSRIGLGSRGSSSEGRSYGRTSGRTSARTYGRGNGSSRSGGQSRLSAPGRSQSGYSYSPSPGGRLSAPGGGRSSGGGGARMSGGGSRGGGGGA